MAQRGRPRKLRENDVDPKIVQTEHEVIHRDGSRGMAENNGFDFRSLEKIKPFSFVEPLPRAEYKEENGKRIRLKIGEPRFFFRRNKLIKVFMDANGKKTQPFRIFKPHKKLDAQIMHYLKTKRGVPVLNG